MNEIKNFQGSAMDLLPTVHSPQRLPRTCRSLGRLSNSRQATINLLRHVW